MCRPQRFVAFWSDPGAASQIGIAIMVLTTAISGGAMYASVADFGVDDELAPRLWDIDSDGSTHWVTLDAGPSIPVKDMHAMVVSGGTSQRAELADSHAPALADGLWERGEQVCIIGLDEDCLFSQGYAIKVKLFGAELMIYEGEGTLMPIDLAGSGEYTLLGGESLGATDDGQASICHKPGTNAEKTMSLPHAALAGHTGHGDTIGDCGSGGGDDGKLVICHKPGDLDLTLTIGYAGWNGHEGHGDTLGAC